MATSTATTRLAGYRRFSAIAPWPVPAPRSRTACGLHAQDVEPVEQLRPDPCLQHGGRIVGPCRAVENDPRTRREVQCQFVAGVASGGDSLLDGSAGPWPGRAQPADSMNARNCWTWRSTSSPCDRNGAWPALAISTKRAAGSRAASSRPAAAGVMRSCSPAITSVGVAMAGSASRRSVSRSISRPACSARGTGSPWLDRLARNARRASLGSVRRPRPAARENSRSCADSRWPGPVANPSRTSGCMPPGPLLARQETRRRRDQDQGRDISRDASGRFRARPCRRATSRAPQHPRGRPPRPRAPGAAGR